MDGFYCAVLIKFNGGYKMNREEAKEYLEKKHKEVTKEEIEKVMKKGKIYGDPIVEMY